MRRVLQKIALHTATNAMSHSTTFNRVVAAMEDIAPLRLADRTWDNVGVMVEAPVPNGSKVVMLTIDYTKEVLQECIAKKVEVLIAYHPPIFAPLKALTLKDPKSSLLLHAVHHGMSIYSPHSALDSTVNGINDWLASGLGAGTAVPIKALEGEDPSVGIGRLLALEEPVSIGVLKEKVKAHLGIPHLRVGLAEGADDSHKIRTVAICAGSGASVIRGCKADVYLTGEMSHHEVLRAMSMGTTCILSEHTHTERGYLRAYLEKKLHDALGDVKVIVSEKDCDPLRIA